MSFNDFIQTYTLKNKVTSNIKIQRALCFVGLNSVGIYLRDRTFESDIGVVNLHPSKGTHSVCFINENYFDTYVCVCPKKLSKFIIKRYGYCLHSEYKIQVLTSKRDSYCASYCLYMLYLTKVISIDFKSSVLDLYYQLI